MAKSRIALQAQRKDGRDALEVQMAANPDFFLGAFEDSSLMGVVIATSDGRRGWINRLAVDPKLMRTGVAKALIGEAEKSLRMHRLRIFCALIEDSNIASLKLFEKCGYKVHRDIVYLSKRDGEQV